MLHRFSIGKQREHAPSEPQVKLYLKKKRFYPGDNLSGVVVVEVYNPFELLTLELKLLGEERSGVGTVLYKRSSYDEKVSLYYLQYVTLLGKNHDEIVHTGTLSQSPSFFRRRSTMTVSQPMTRPSFLGTIPKGDNEEEKEEGERESKTESSKRRKSKAGNPSMNPEELQQASINISRNMNLMTGTYVIPFQVQLANDLPPTMSIDKGRDAHSTLFYSCQARLISQGGKQYKTTRRFGIQPLPVQLQRWLIIQRAVRESEDPEGTKGGPVRRSEGDAIDNDDTLSRYTTMTLQTNADGKTKSEDDVALNHRLRHNIQLPEELLEEEEEESRSTRKSAKKAKGQLTLDAVEQLDKLNKSKEEDGGDGEDVVAFKEDDEEPEPESTRKSKPRRHTRNSVIPEDRDGESEEPEEAKDAKPEEGKEGEETKGSKKDSIITTWEEQFKIPIRSGVLGTSKSVVEVHLVFASIVLVRQRAVLKVKALIDNSEGNSTINKIKYSIVTRGCVPGEGG
ncbi:hypothetical protein AGDE_15685 [Angomonas deanei]|uniref:Arrestin (Or S-antigen), N-terminal domain containing protein n=1 Tax=Angomonas deanei TaxID=59799 RepID=A0A7G2BZR2_9TRYP|nr:hypothetical protein AGDE_15685 [Angomonas deanei]CAD2212966.1 hypothetical protein, conserved [Angomonas deanei]|eukprot:EPY18649.1 hypothetical protein AGDE_15685 [Angomonas deanei]